MDTVSQLLCRLLCGDDLSPSTLDKLIADDEIDVDAAHRISKLVRRRRFLQNSTVLALTLTLPSFLANSLEAATASKNETILVVIQLDGGNDGNNTVVPYRDEQYAEVA